jgi:hypothetical protein
VAIETRESPDRVLESGLYPYHSTTA